MYKRQEQLIGLPPQDGNTHFSVLRVNPADLYRPSRDNEIDDTQAELTFPEDATEEYKEWFESNAEYSYQPHRYPWTGLGYTYDLSLIHIYQFLMLAKENGLDGYYKKPMGLDDKACNLLELSAKY